MTLRAAGIGACLLVALSAGFAACSLNPQPLPPYNYDAAGPLIDAAMTNPEAGSGGDAGAMGDSTVPQGGDAEADADAESSADAEADAASDAPTDAMADASSDSSDDAEADATGD